MRFFAQWRRTDIFGRIWQHKRLIAITIGVVLAGVPLLAFDFWLADLVNREGSEEAANLARRTVTLGETRIERATTALDALAAQGISVCSTENVAALGKAIFAVTPVKDIAILGPEGQVLCSGQGAGEQVMLTSEPLMGAGDVSLDVIRLGSESARYVRIRRPLPSGTGSLAALIPAELFMPMVTTQGGQFNAFAQVYTPGGNILVETPGWRERADDKDAFSGRIKSDRFGVGAAIVVPRARVVSISRDLGKVSLFVPGAIAVLLMAFAALLPKRQPSNPVAELQRAIDAGEFVPYYQPVVDIRSGKLIGAEVLVRWKRPDGTLTLPGAFIPLAESTGLIVDLTLNLMRRVCADAGPAIASRPAFKVSFNFTAKLFASRTIVRDVRRIFTAATIPITQIVFEVTEREPIVDLTETRQVIAALQGLGARVAIDDVGTGHSGLSYMLKLGVDIIKIDKMFVDAIGTDRKSTTIVETLVDLAHNMRMDIIAEGVENFEQVAHLRELGIRAAQGYVFAPPLPGSAFLQLLDAIDPVAGRVGQENSRHARRYLSARTNFAAAEASGN